MNNLKYAGDVIYAPKLICIVLQALLPTALKGFVTLLNHTYKSPLSGPSVGQTYIFGKYLIPKVNRRGKRTSVPSLISRAGRVKKGLPCG